MSEQSVSKFDKFGLYTVLQSWFLMIGFDFFLHAGLLNQLYNEENGFLLDPLQSFIRIPLGYISFLLLAIFLYYLQVKINVIGGRSGFIFGLQIGLLIWGSFLLGLYSISTITFPLLIGWYFGQSVEMALAGLVTGHILETSEMQGTLKRVSLATLIFLILGIVIQNFL